MLPTLLREAPKDGFWKILGGVLGGFWKSETFLEPFGKRPGTVSGAQNPSDYFVFDPFAEGIQDWILASFWEGWASILKFCDINFERL